MAIEPMSKGQQILAKAILDAGPLLSAPSSPTLSDPYGPAGPIMAPNPVSPSAPTGIPVIPAMRPYPGGPFFSPGGKQLTPAGAKMRIAATPDAMGSNFGFGG